MFPCSLTRASLMVEVLRSRRSETSSCNGQPLKCRGSPVSTAQPTHDADRNAQPCLDQERLLQAVFLLFTTLYPSLAWAVRPFELERSCETVAVVSGGRVVQRGRRPSTGVFSRQRFPSGSGSLAGSFSELITDSSGHLAQIMRFQARPTELLVRRLGACATDRSGELEET